MQNNRVIRVHDYWQQIRPNGGLPRRSDFSPSEITECLPYIFIMERKEAPDGGRPDYIFRLIGTQLVTLFGADPTGRSVFEVLAPDAAEFFGVLYGHILGHPAGCVTHFTQSFGLNEDSEMEFLYLPMVLDDEKGEPELILIAGGMENDNTHLSDMGGRWETPKLIDGGWLDIGFGKPEDPFLQNVCAATGAVYLDL